METGFVLKSAKCGDGRKTEKKKKVFFSVCVKNWEHTDFKLYNIITGRVWLNFCNSCHMYKASGLLALSCSNSQCKMRFPFPHC